MDGLVVLAVLLAGALLVLPIVAVVMAAGAKRRALEIETKLGAREKELRWLYEKYQALEKQVGALERKGPAEPAAAPAPPEVVEAIGPPLAADTPPPVAETTRPSAPSPEAPIAGPAEPTHAPPPPPPPPPPRPRAPTPQPGPAFEQRLAGWLTKIGAGVALLGVLYFFKYAVDSNLIGPTGRVLVGVIAGVIALGAAEKLRASTQPAFVQLLVGLGLAFLFVAMWAASALYALIPVEAGFAGNAVVLLIGAALAWHHKGQAILVLALLAVFLNPVLLSTGVDRPFALFSYLLAFTGVMLAVAVKLRFAVAMAVAVVGVCALFTGWYERYFDIHDHRAMGFDLPPEQLVGAYHALSARITPLVFVGLFAAEWLVAAFALKRSGATQRWTVPMALSALLLAHAGWAALVPDHPATLGAAMVVAGGIGIAALHALERTDLLMVPMIAAFFILAAQLPDVPAADQTVVLAILGAWTAVYVLAFLRSASDAHRTIERGAAIRGAIGLGVFTVLAAILLLDHHRSTAFTLVVVAVTLVVLVLAHRAALAGLAIAALTACFMLLLGAIDQRAYDPARPVDLGLLTGILAWSALHAGGVVYAVARRRSVGWLELLTLSASTLGAVLLVVAATPDSVPTLRALIAAAAGITDLAMAAWISRQRPELSAWVSILAAQALGLFATSMALALSGATVTVLWAILALIAAAIWARDESPAWIALLVVLVFATVLRLLAIDVGESNQLVELYRWTEGRQGVYRLAPLFNARAFALVGTGAAFLGAALALSRSPRPHRRAFAGAMAILGHLMLIGLSVSELRALALELPEPPPMILDRAEFGAFWATVDAAESEQSSKLDMVTTLTLAGAAMVLLGIGFAAKDAFHRYLGLAVFVGTIVKLIGWDVWSLARTYQIIALTVVGALLLGSGFLYARLRSLFTGKGALVLLAGLAALGVAPRAEASPLDVHAYASRRAITGVTAPGDYGLTVDVPMYTHSLAASLLADVRIVGPGGEAVPHLQRTVVMEAGWASEEGRMLDPGLRGDGVYQAVFELPGELVFCRVDLAIEGPSPYLRRVDVEAGEDVSSLRLVTTGALVYSIHGDSGAVTESSVRVPRSQARRVRLSLRPDRESAESNRITGARFVACAPDGSAPPTDSVPLAIVETRRDAQKRQTVIDLDAGIEGLPLIAIDLDTTTAELVRRVDVSASAYKNAWPHVTSAYVSRVDDPRRPVDSTTIHLGELRKRWIRLTFHDGDDAPIAIRGVTGRVARREIIFRASAPGPHTLYLGDKAGSDASYDLAEIYDRRSDEPARRAAAMGAIEPNPTFGRPEVPRELPFTEQHRGPIGIGLGVVLLALALYAVRLLRKG